MFQSTPIRRSLVLAFLGTVGCNHSSSSAPLVGAEKMLAEATVDAQGGTVQVTTPGHPLLGTRITFPAGALAGPETIQIFSTQRFPELQPPGLVPLARDVPQTVLGIRVEPSRLVLNVPAMVTLAYTEQYEDQLLPRFLLSLSPRQDLADELAVFARRGGQSKFRFVAPTDADADDRNVRFSTLALGDFFPLHPFLYASLYQESKLVDPAVPLLVRDFEGTVFEDPAGDLMVSVGHGSLASFFSSDASQNVIVIHGLASSPLDFVGTDDFLPADPSRGLRAMFPNVIAYQYPTTRSVADNANFLYDQLRSRMQAGFGCNIIAHSMGGLVARYLLERSHLDASRPGFQPGDRPLVQRVRSLVTVGTPHEGAGLANTAFSFLGLFNVGSDPVLFSGISDLREGTGTFTKQLNRPYQDNATRYFFIGGNVAGGTDLVVSVESATEAVPLMAPEAKLVLGRGTEFEHGRLHVCAAQNGVLQAVFGFLMQP